MSLLKNMSDKLTNTYDIIWFQIFDKPWVLNKVFTKKIQIILSLTRGVYVQAKKIKKTKKKKGTNNMEMKHSCFED